jgi:hypothetical protein
LILRGFGEMTKLHAFGAPGRMEHGRSADSSLETEV